MFRSRFVCEDFPLVKEAMDGSRYLVTYDIKSYETMTAICERYNKAVDNLRSVVRVAGWRMLLNVNVKQCNTVLQDKETTSQH